MQVLTSGSFINLDNQEKIERLIFTAQEIAMAAASADGFNNEEESNQKFALEIWQSAEYMCREQEEARIRGIFTNAFLERLRELRGAAQALPIAVSEEILSSPPQAPVKETKDSQDEFLGLVSNRGNDVDDTGKRVLTEEGEIRMAVSGNEIFEQKNKGQERDISESEELMPGGTQEYLSESSALFEIAETEEVDSETEKPHEEPQNEMMAEVPSIRVSATSDAITLSEKEPYRWDECTVTTAIQLLAANPGSANRKVVLSVRTHDFAPQISMIELNSGNLPQALLAEIQKAWAKYEADLPLKVMDKLKREKIAPKKQAQPAAQIKSISPATAGTETSKVSPAEVRKDSPETAAAIIPAQPEAGQQGSLFV